MINRHYLVIRETIDKGCAHRFYRLKKLLLSGRLRFGQIDKSGPKDLQVLGLLIIAFCFFSTVCSRLQAFTSVYKRLQAFTSVYIRLQAFAGVYRRLYPFAGVYIRLQAFISVY